jgi:hypothetical protein
MIPPSTERLLCAGSTSQSAIVCRSLLLAALRDRASVALAKLRRCAVGCVNSSGRLLLLFRHGEKAGLQFLTPSLSGCGSFSRLRGSTGASVARTPAVGRPTWRRGGLTMQMHMEL